MSAATMRAVRYLGPKQDFVLRTVAIPEPGPGEVRVRVVACGVCRTELHLRDGLLDLGRRDFTVGHEIAGTIDVVGPSADPARIGQRVIVYYYEGCGECRYCRVGDEQLCPRPRAQPGFTTDGGYAEYITVRARNCVPVPDSVSLSDIAPMGCAGSTAVHAGRMAAIRPRDWVVVHGTGGVGLALLQYARAAGARVIAIDRDATKLERASRLGAVATIDVTDVAAPEAAVAAITGEGADVVFELVGTAETMRRSAVMLRRRGRLVLVGYTADSLTIHPIDIIVRELAVLGSVGSTLQDLHEVVALVESGAITPFVERALPLAEFGAALSAVEEQRAIGRIVLLPG